MTNRKKIVLEMVACAHLIEEHRLWMQEDGRFYCWFCLRSVGDVDELRVHVATRKHRIWRAILRGESVDQVEAGARAPGDPAPIYVEKDGQMVEPEKCPLCHEYYGEARVRTVLHATPQGEHATCRTCAVDLFAHSVDDNRDKPRSCPFCDRLISIRQNVPQLDDPIRNAKAALLLRRKRDDAIEPVSEREREAKRAVLVHTMRSLLALSAEVASNGSIRQRNTFFEEFGVELLTILKNYGELIGDLNALLENYGESLENLERELVDRLAEEQNALALPEQLRAAERMIMHEAQNRLDQHRATFQWELIQQRVADGVMECQRPDEFCRQSRQQRGAYYRAPCGHYFCFSCGQHLNVRRGGCMVTGQCGEIYGFVDLTVVNPIQDNNGGVPAGLPASFVGTLGQARRRAQRQVERYNPYRRR